MIQLFETVDIHQNTTFEYREYSQVDSDEQLFLKIQEVSPTQSILLRMFTILKLFRLSLLKFVNSKNV